LPHPSPRNNIWLAINPRFEGDLLLLQIERITRALKINFKIRQMITRGLVLYKKNSPGSEFFEVWGKLGFVIVLEG
jgi:hypothetical protein